MNIKLYINKWKVNKPAQAWDEKTLQQCSSKTPKDGEMLKSNMSNSEQYLVQYGTIWHNSIYCPNTILDA